MKTATFQERVSAIFTMVEFQGFCSREDFRELAEAAGGWHSMAGILISFFLLISSSRVDVRFFFLRDFLPETNSHSP